MFRVSVRDRIEFILAKKVKYYMANLDNLLGVTLR